MLIPIQDAHGTIIREEEEEHVLRNRHHFQLVYNRRKHLKRVIFKGRNNSPVVSLSRNGLSFEQELPGGRVWALRGIEGSR